MDICSLDIGGSIRGALDEEMSEMCRGGGLFGWREGVDLGRSGAEGILQ